MKNPMMNIPAIGPSIAPQIVELAWTSCVVNLEARQAIPIVSRPKNATEQLITDSLYSSRTRITVQDNESTDNMEYNESTDNME